MQSIVFAAILFCPPPCANAGGNHGVTGEDIRPPAISDEYQTLSTPRFTLYIETDKRLPEQEDRRTNSIATEALQILNQNFEELSRIFDTQPQKKVVLRFLSPTEFHRQTGAPDWTSAMYYRGEITVPIHPDRKVNYRQLSRALRHEYVHAIVAELSANRCPAWLDEGIAQLIEGEPNPVLGPALRNWVARDIPLPLSWLENGFTTLDDGLVPAAYAQSLFATRTLVNRLGFQSIRNYLRFLQEGLSSEDAFRRAFHKNQSTFEAELALQIYRWAKSSNPHP